MLGDECSQAKFQEEKVVTAAIDLMRVDGNLSTVVAFFEASAGCKILKAGFDDELALMRMLAKPMDHMVTPSELMKARKAVESNKGGRFHKALTLFATGKSLLAAVDAAVEQRASDESFELKFKECNEIRNSMPSEIEVDNSTFEFPALPDVEKLWQLYNSCVAGASRAFKAQHYKDAGHKRNLK